MKHILRFVLLVFLAFQVIPSQGQSDGAVPHISSRIPVQGAVQQELGATRVPVRTSKGDLAGANVSPTANPWKLISNIPNGLVTDISFATPLEGYAVGELGRVWKTTDGGVTWTLLLALEHPYYFYGVVAHRGEVVISGTKNNTSQGIVRWSHDGGETWDPEIVLPSNGFSVRFADASHGLVMSGLAGDPLFPNSANFTANGGQAAADWDRVTPAPGGGWFAPQFSLLPTMHAAASGIQYCASTDAGANWTCRPSIDSIFDGPVYFLNDTYGWVGGGEISPSVQGWLHRTTDGGATWSDRTLSSNWPIRRIQFISPQVGWAAGGDFGFFSGVAVGGIYFTSDGGQNWSLDLDSLGNEMSACDAMAIGGGFQVWCAGFTVAPNSVVYTVKGAGAPILSLAAGSYVGEQTVSMTTGTTGASIFYTTDGTVPTTASAVYTTPIAISNSTTLKAIAGGTDFMASGVATAAYTITPPQLQVSTSNSAISVRGGQAATAAFAVSANAAPGGPVSFACSGLPVGTQCQFSPATMAATALPGNVTVTIPTTGTMAVKRRGNLLWTLGLVVPGFVLLSSKSGQRRRAWCGLFAILLSAIVMSGCGGSGSAALTGGSHSTTYDVTVTASATGINAGSMHIQLTVTN